MIPLLIWFIFILLVALLACLAIKFLTLRVILAIILCLPILVSIAYCVLRRSPVNDSNIQKQNFFDSLNVISDRGETSGTVKQDTIPAFRLAKQNGADAIKMDVRMTKDGMLIIFHSDSVSSDNSTFIVGETHWIQMSQINVYGGKNGTIVTFDEAVSWCIANKMKMIWNLPDYSGDLLTYLRNKMLQESLYGMVAVTTSSTITCLKIRLADSDLIMGMTWKSTEYSIVDGQAVGNMYTSWFFSMMDSFSYWGIRSLLLPNFLGVDFVATSVDDADRALIVEYSEVGIKTVIYDLVTTQERNYFAVQTQLPVIVKDVAALFGSSSTPSNSTKKASKS